MIAPAPAARHVADVPLTELVDLAFASLERGQAFNAAHFLRVAADRLEKKAQQAHLVVVAMGLKP